MVHLINPKYGSCCIAIMLHMAVVAQSKLYTLSELSDSLKNHWPVLSEQANLVDAAKVNIIQTKNSFLPRLRAMEELNIGTDNSIAGSYFPLGIIPSTSGGIRSGNDYHVSAGNVGILYGEYDLINFGFRRASIENAQALTNLQESDFSRQLYYARLELSRVYFKLLKSQATLSADDENVKRYENIFTIIRALAKSGIKPGADSSLARAELSRAQISYNQTRGLVDQLKEQLSFWTGLSPQNINIDTLALRKVLIRPELFYPGNDTAQSPVLDYYRRVRDVYAVNRKLIGKSYLPRITLIASAWGRGSSIGYNDKFGSLPDGFGFRRFNYAAGLAFTYDLFNEIHKKDKLNINRFQLQAADEEISQQKLILNTALHQANNVIRTTEANLLELPVQIDAARATYNQKLAQYKAGIINLIDLTNAAFVLYRSVNDYTETLTDWYLAQLDKATATNKLDLFIQTIK